MTDRRTNIEVVIVTGGRDYTDNGELWAALDSLKCWTAQDCLEIWQGECPSGADHMARQWCRKTFTPYRSFPAKWDDINRPGAVVRTRKNGGKYDAAAGPARNKLMVQTAVDGGYSVTMLATRGGDGTRNAIQCAFDAGVEIIPLKDRDALMRKVSS